MTDSTPPTGALITGPVSLSKPFQIIKSLKVTWTATDAESGIAKYELIARSATLGGVFGAPTTSQLSTLTGTTFVIVPGTTYCFKIRATNGSGLTADSPERCTAQPLSSYAMGAQGTWTKKKKAGYYFGQFRVAKVTGATLIKKGVTVKRLAIIATRMKGAGTVTIFLGTKKLKTIKLAATTTRKRQVIAIANFTKVRKGTVKIVITSSGKPVIIEGLAVSKV